MREVQLQTSQVSGLDAATVYGSRSPEGMGLLVQQ